MNGAISFEAFFIPMTIKELIIYPVKGLKGINVESANLTVRGFEHDRRYMLIDESGYFLSQRSHPELATFHTQLTAEGHLIVSVGEYKLVVTQDDITDRVVEAGIFEHLFPVHLLSEKINNWWTQLLGISVNMVAQTQSDTRIKYYIGDGDKTELSLADGYPYLIAGTASLSQLNDKLTVPLPLDRFRANIIVYTEEPHVEDTWKYINVGDNEKMYVVKPCARCQVITIDQSTGAKGKEPLVTLAKYRKEGNKINFGANAIALTTGSISVGDVISPQ